MRIGIVSDIHANSVALQTVLEDMRPVDKIICCGDIIGYGPNPRECVEIARSEFDVCVRGNHDRDVADPERYLPGSGVYEGLKHAVEELDSEQFNWVTTLNRRQDFQNYQMVHSHPENVDQYVYPNGFNKMFQYVGDSKGLFLGHTHYQQAKKNNDRIVMNPGSVGQPRDGDSRAAYGIVETDDNSYELNRVEYDIKKVQRQMREAGLPEKSRTRLERGK